VYSGTIVVTWMYILGIENLVAESDVLDYRNQLVSSLVRAALDNFILFKAVSIALLMETLLWIHSQRSCYERNLVACCTFSFSRFHIPLRI
jgi:hypothetical protein